MQRNCEDTLSSGPKLLNIQEGLAALSKTVGSAWQRLIKKIPCHTCLVSERDHIFCLIASQWH